MYFIRDWLYIGKYAQTRRLNLLNQVGITSMLQLADYVPQPHIETLFLDVKDGEATPHVLFKRGITFIREQKAQGQTVLVACGAGISRSSTFALAALMEEENRSIFDAYKEIYLRHHRAEPHFELIRSLASYHGQDMSLMEAYDGLYATRQTVFDEVGV